MKVTEHLLIIQIQNSEFSESYRTNMDSFCFDKKKIIFRTNKILELAKIKTKAFKIVKIISTNLVRKISTEINKKITTKFTSKLAKSIAQKRSKHKVTRPIAIHWYNDKYSRDKVIKTWIQISSWNGFFSST